MSGTPINDSYVSLSGGTRVFGPTYGFLTDLNGVYIQAVNPVTDRLYFASGSDLRVRDGTSHAVVAAIPSASGDAVGVDTAFRRQLPPASPACSR